MARGETARHKNERHEGVSFRYLCLTSGHIPPGVVNYRPQCYKQFAVICKHFRDIIGGQFYGHMNIDHFYFPTTDLELSKRSHDSDFRTFAAGWIPAYVENLKRHYRGVQKQKHLPMPVFVAPSVVPAFNPAFRVWRCSEGGLLGYTQYHMDLAVSENYTVEYTTNDYKMFTANVNDWKLLARKLSKEHKYTKLRNHYFRNLLVGRNPRP